MRGSPGAWLEDGMMQRILLRIRYILAGLVLSVVWIVSTQQEGLAQRVHQGPTEADLLQTVGVVAAILAIGWLVTVEFFLVRRIQPATQRALLFGGLLVLPAIVLISSGATVLEETKRVAACGSCHVMDPFVNDMQNPQSASLAARHFRNRWIADHQCYHCHTGYGAHGTLAGKRDGLRHWLLYVTSTYKEPIEFSGSYPNANCLECHAGQATFQEVTSHQALSDYLGTDQVGCVACHGPPHPVPGERVSSR